MIILQLIGSFFLSITSSQWTNRFCHYRPPTKLDEGNAFTGVSVYRWYPWYQVPFGGGYPYPSIWTWDLGQPPLPDTYCTRMVGMQAVRIPLECFLVLPCVYRSLTLPGGYWPAWLIEKNSFSQMIIKVISNCQGPVILSRLDCRIGNLGKKCWIVFMITGGEEQ